jgi:hypothetical protein
MEESGRGLISRHYLSIRLAVPRKPTKTSVRIVVTESRLAPGTSIIRSSLVNHSNTTFGVTVENRICVHTTFLPSNDLRNWILKKAYSHWKQSTMLFKSSHVYQNVR